MTPERILTVPPPRTPGQTQSWGSRLWSVSAVIKCIQSYMETGTHRQRPVLIIGALSVQGPRAAQAGAGGREEREGHLANTFY